MKNKVSVEGTGQRWPGKEGRLRVEVAGERSDKVSVTGAQTAVGPPSQPGRPCILLGTFLERVLKQNRFLPCHQKDAPSMLTPHRHNWTVGVAQLLE